MTIFYLETSALLKRYKTESGTESVNQLFIDRSPEDVLVTSYFTTVEVEAAAARARKGRLLSEKSYRVLLSWFAEDLGENILLQPVTDALLSASAELARRYGLRAGDAIHLAAASGVRKAATPDAVLVTSDEELLFAAQREAFSTLDPRFAGPFG